MAAINEITGDSITSKYSSKYNENYNSIFRKLDTEVECNHLYGQYLSEVYPVCVLCGHINKETVYLRDTSYSKEFF